MTINAELLNINEKDDIMKICDECGGLVATEDLEKIAGRICLCLKSSSKFAELEFETMEELNKYVTGIIEDISRGNISG